MQTGVIIYYIVGPVHLHNLKLIAQQMPTWEFRVAYETDVAWFTPAQMRALTFETIPLSDTCIPEQLWSGDVCTVIFSTTQLRRTPVNLLQEALKRNIPTIAIEESNQIALNSGRINNYLLSVDHLLVASESERRGMIAAGVLEQNVEVTGWPFYTGQVGKISSQRVRERKAHFGLDADRPVAALTLTALSDAGESPEVRSRQLSLAASGLPDNYQLVVKPHPIEPLEELIPFVRECAPQAKIIPGNVPISDLLEATDVLLNRGVSQVCFQAIMREIPVIILETGIQTPFHGLVPDDLIVSDFSELTAALDKVTGEQNAMRLYRTFITEHFPYAPASARELTCQRIKEITHQKKDDRINEKQWFDLALYQAWLRSPQKALANLTHCRENGLKANAEALKRLITLQATTDDLETLKTFLDPGLRQAIVQSLWIHQLYRSEQRPGEQEIAWLQDFPPITNTSWFIPFVHQWAAVLIRVDEQEVLRNFANRLDREFLHEAGMDVLVQHLKNYQINFIGRMKYYLYTVALDFRTLLRPMTRWFSSLLLKIRSKSDLRKGLSN